jgi:hypothetical protein
MRKKAKKNGTTVKAFSATDNDVKLIAALQRKWDLPTESEVMRHAVRKCAEKEGLR